MYKGLAIVTGADGGMGAVLSETLTRAGYEVIMACYDANVAKPVYERIRTEVDGSIRLAEVDLACPESVIAFTGEVTKQYSSLQLLLNNAGVLCRHAQSNNNGIEYTATVNYLGAYLLTNLLLPIMGRGTRVVSTISLSYRYGKITPTFFEPKSEAKFNRFQAYADSKLALYYFMRTAAREWGNRGISFFCADPGIVDTDIIRLGKPVIDKLCDLIFRPHIHTREQGASAMLMAALSPELKDCSDIIIKNGKRKKPVQHIEQNVKQQNLLRILTQQILEKNHIVWS